MLKHTSHFMVRETLKIQTNLNLLMKNMCKHEKKDQSGT